MLPQPSDSKNNGEFRAFTDGWNERHLRVHGCPYKFGKAKDAQAVKRLLADSGLSVQELLEIAEAAWALPAGGKRDYERGHSMQISSFDSQFNKIRDAVKTTSPLTAENAAWVAKMKF